MGKKWKGFKAWLSRSWGGGEGWMGRLFRRSVEMTVKGKLEDKGRRKPTGRQPARRRDGR